MSGITTGSSPKVTFWMTVPGTTKSEPRTTTVARPTVQPEQTVEIGPADVPITCYRPDGVFKISVDGGKQVDETNETKNEINGLCIG
jgi:hypothetical protein